MKSLYVRVGLWLIRPILDAYHEQRVSEQAKLKLVKQTHDLRRPMKNCEWHL